MDMGWIGGLFGSAIGVMGGVFGTWCSWRAARSDAERRFVLWCALGFTTGIALFLVAMLLPPVNYRGLWWIPYAILLMLAINACNRRQQQIRNEQATQTNHTA